MAMTEGVLRVASINVCRLCPVTRRGRSRARSLRGLLAKLDADLVALQELEHQGSDAHRSLLSESMHLTVGKHSRSGTRGVGVLCATPFLQEDHGRLSARWGDDKGYVRVVVTPHAMGSAVEFIGVHLDPFSPRARFRQIDALAREVGAPSMPRIVAGDLNAMSAKALLSGRDHDETVSALSEALGVRSGIALKTFPNRFPRLAIDWVLASPDLSFRAMRREKTNFSDHAAIVAELCMP